MNEILFIIYVLLVSTAALITAKWGRDALVGLICVEAVLMNLFVIKQITLFGLTATASDALAVGTTLSLNLLQEYYQKPAAQKAIWISFFCSVFYTIMSVLHLAYLPAPTDTSAALFGALLTPMPRIVIASLTVYVLVSQLDAFLYGYFKERFGEHYFVARNYLSLALTQLVDTILFSFLGLYGINESFSKLSTLFDIILISFIIKLVVILIAVPFVKFAKGLKLFKQAS